LLDLGRRGGGGPGGRRPADGRDEERDERGRRRGGGTRPHVLPASSSRLLRSERLACGPRRFQPSSNTKAQPPSRTSSTQMGPSCRSTTARASASPRPYPALVAKRV